MARLLLLTSLLNIVWQLANSQSVTFPSGASLETVDESTLDPATVALVEDPLNTGTPLFVTDTFKDDNIRVSKNFAVKDFRSSWSETDYFRLHPALVACVQQVYDHVYKTAKTKVQVDQGYVVDSQLEPGAPAYASYARTGCGASLHMKNGGGLEGVKVLAQAVFTHCPFTFALEMRDIGLVATASSVYVYMAEPGALEPYVASEGFTDMTTTQLQQWGLDVIDQSLVPLKTPDCSGVPPLAAQQTHPASTSLEQAAGSLDTPITRLDPDFKRLIQFAGRTVDFEDSESSAAWCGHADNPCVACGAKVKGQSAASRCADRLMTPRLHAVLRKLQALTEQLIGSPARLRVLEAWDEGYAGQTAGDSVAGSVHFEGRALVVQLTGSSDYALLGSLAMCAGADYVKNEGDRLTIAVKKQEGLIPRHVKFPSNRMLAVAPPSAVADTYSLPGDARNYPLFDSDSRESLKLGEHATIDAVNTGGTRYFRIDPALVKCYDAIVTYEKRWATDAAITVDIVHGFMTRPQLEEHFEPEFDPRRWGHTYGTALRLKYPDIAATSANDTIYTMHRLSQAAILNCAPIFTARKAEMGLGVYTDGVYIDMRNEFKLWTDNPQAFPAGVSLRSMRTRYIWAAAGRMFNPTHPAVACSPGTPPLRQSPDYVYQHSGYVEKRRQKRAVGVDDTTDCTPSADTDHCRISQTHRQREIAHMLVEIKRKEPNLDKDDITRVLEKCFGECGTCVKGVYWEDKVEQCNNLLHWVPFALHNEQPHSTNLYFRGNRNLKQYACAGERHCVDKAPLFTAFAPSVEALFRPDATRSVEYELYGTDNPLPIFELVYQIYGMNANGTVNVWVKNEVEMEYLRTSLLPIMVYNDAVTRVKIYVLEPKRKPDVNSILNGMMREWGRTICPDLARVAMPPYDILDMPEGIVKRDVEEEQYDFTETLALKRKMFEQHWISKTLS